MVERYIKIGKQNVIEFLKNHGINMLYVLIIPFLFWVFLSHTVYSRTGFTLYNHIHPLSDISSYYVMIAAAIRSGMFSGTAGYTGYLFGSSGGLELEVASHLFYGAHGFFILLPYIILGNIFGWTGSSVLFINLTIITIAFYFVYFSTKSIRVTYLIQLSIFLFVPFLAYFPTLMMETQIHAWGIIVMSMLYRYNKEKNTKSRVGLLLSIVLSSFARATNLVFIIPYFLLELQYIYINNKNNLKKLRLFDFKFLFLGSACVMLSLIFIYVTIILISPSFSISFIHGLGIAFFEHGFLFALNLVRLRILSQTAVFFSSFERVLFISVRYGVFGLSLILLIFSFIDIKDSKIKLRFHIESFSLFMILFVITFFNIAFYDVFAYRDFRLLKSVLSAVMVYIFLSYKSFCIIPKILFGYILSSLFFISIFFYNIGLFFGHWHVNNWSSYIVYSENVQNRLENTILIHTNFIDHFWDIDPGLGVVADLTWGSFTYEELASTGIRYVVMPVKNLSAYPWYELVSYGDSWVVYRLVNLNE